MGVDDERRCGPDNRITDSLTAPDPGRSSWTGRSGWAVHCAIPTNPAGVSDGKRSRADDGGGPRSDGGPQQVNNQHRRYQLTSAPRSISRPSFGLVVRGVSLWTACLRRMSDTVYRGGDASTKRVNTPCTRCPGEPPPYRGAGFFVPSVGTTIPRREALRSACQRLYDHPGRSEQYRFICRALVACQNLKLNIYRLHSWFQV